MNFLNIIVDNGNVKEEDRAALFPNNEMVHVLRKGHPWLSKTGMLDILITMGCFKSKSQARKNWKGPHNIPEGWSEFFIGKKRRHLCIFNPTE